MVIEHDKPRELNAKDFDLMNIPIVGRRARTQELDPQIRKVLTSYLKNRKTYAQAGKSFLFMGTPGSGKTSCIGVCLLNLTSFGYTSYYTTGSGLREASRDRHMIGDTSLLQHCKSVDVLAIDDLTLEDASDRYFGSVFFQALIKHRTDWLKPTFLATSVGPSEFSVAFRNMVQFPNHIVPLRLPTRDKSAKWINDLLGGKT